MRADVAGAPEDRALDQAAATDVRGRIDDGAGRARALAQRDGVRQDGVLPDAGAGSNAGVVPDQCRSFHLIEVCDLDTLAEPDVAADPDTGNVQPHLLVERVEVRLAVLVEVPDVLPVAVHHVAVQRPAHLEQVRKQLLGEVVRPVGRDVLQHLGLEHVDARVDRVGEDLTPRRLLEKALDPSLLVRDDDPELERVVDRLETDRHGCAALLVECDELPEVDVAERVAGDDEERLVKLPRREPHRARCAERRLFDGVADAHAERVALAEVASDRLRQERNGDDDVRQPVLAKQLEDVLHARLADDGHHRLRLIRRQRTQARALAAGHDHGLHRLRCLHTPTAYSTPATTARTRPVQKIQYGQSVDRCVTSRQPIPR